MTDCDKRTLTRTHSHQISKLIYTEMIYSGACACVLHINFQLVVFEKISNIFECTIKCTHGRQNGGAYGKKETFFIFFSHLLAVNGWGLCEFLYCPQNEGIQLIYTESHHKIQMIEWVHFVHDHRTICQFFDQHSCPLKIIQYFIHFYSVLLGFVLFCFIWF